MAAKDKILTALECNPSGLSISDLARKTGLHRNTVSPNVSELLEKGELKYKMVGQAKVYYLSHDHGLHGGIKMDKNQEKNVYAGVGISKNDDPYEAGKEAAEMAVMKCGKEPNFGLVFTSSRYKNKELVKGIQKIFDRYNNFKWVGCTASAQISNYGATTDSCVCMVISSKYLRIGVGIGKNTDVEPVKAGMEAGKQALSSLEIDKNVDPYIQYLAMKKLPISEVVRIKPYSVLLLTPGFTMQKPSRDSEILYGLTKVVGKYMPIVGGAASNAELSETYLFYNGEVYQDTSIVVALMHDTKVGFSMEHGYVPTGKYAMVTKSENNIVYELDGKPALDRYAVLLNKSTKDIWSEKMQMEKFPIVINTMIKVASKLGKDVMELNPMAITVGKNPFGVRDVHGDYWLKTPFHVVDKKYLKFYEDIPKNTLLYIMEAAENDLMNASKKAFNDAAKDMDVVVAIFFECALRKWRLGKNADKVIKELSDFSDCAIVGFYSDGEFGAIKEESSNKHSITSVCMAFGNNILHEIGGAEK